MYKVLLLTAMVPKSCFPLLSCIFLLLNPFLLFSHASSPDRQNHTRGLASDFFNALTGARKGTTNNGLSQLKKYLSNLGYMTNNDGKNPTHVEDEIFDDNLELAIKKYQKFFKLPVTGILDTRTAAKLQQPRCSVADLTTYSTKELKFPTIGGSNSKYSFLPGKPRWTKRSLTYAFPTVRTDVNDSLLFATWHWSLVSPLRFSYTTDYYNADLKVSFQIRDHGDRAPFDGPGGIFAHAFGPNDGRIHLDGEDEWVNGVKPGAIDLLTVLMHELGHALGLGHSDDEQAIMYPYIKDGERRLMTQDDINGIRALYT